MGNLWGLLDQTERGLIETDNLTRAIFANKGFLGLRHESPGEWPLQRIDNDGKTVRGGTYLTGTTKGDEICYSVQAESPWYHLKFWRLFGLLDDIDHFDCLELVTLVKDIDLALAKVRNLKSIYTSLRQPTKELSEGSVRDFLQNVAALSGDMKFIAFRWSVAAGAGTSLNNLVRIAQVSAIVATSEYANQLKPVPMPYSNNSPPMGSIVGSFHLESHSVKQNRQTLFTSMNGSMQIQGVSRPHWLESDRLLIE